MPQYQLDELRGELPYVNLFFGTNNIYKLPQLLKSDCSPSLLLTSAFDDYYNDLSLFQ